MCPLGAQLHTNYSTKTKCEIVLTMYLYLSYSTSTKSVSKPQYHWKTNHTGTGIQLIGLTEETQNGSWNKIKNIIFLLH